MPDCASPIAIRLLGPFEVLLNGQPLPRLRSRKGEWLLALLALRAGRGYPRSGWMERDWLEAVLWPESPEAKAQVSLRVSLKDLRRALGPVAPLLRSPTPHTLCLDLTVAGDLGGVWMDVSAFEGLIRMGDETSLEEAVALYRGPLLEGCMEPWVFEERQAREETYLAAREALAAHALARGDTVMAEHHLRHLVARDPLRESAQRRLMQALAAGGNYAAALRAYRELRTLLHHELHAEPDPETREAFEQIRAEARRRSRPLPIGNGVVPFQARKKHAEASAGDGAAARARPAAPRAQAPPHNLPCQLTSFVGREEEIAEIHRLLSTGRLVTLTGPGGCGKTRLAFEVTGDLVEEFADGVWLVELAVLSASTRVPEAVIAAVGLKQAGEGDLTNILTQHLQPRKLLLVLDNCEPHVAACAALSEALLRVCPNLQILATSLEALGVSGERLYPVPPLSVPRIQAFRSSGVQEEPADNLMHYDAVSLFVDRATAVLPTFRLTPQIAPAVAEVCRRLDGMPLAIELAAARVKLLSVEQIAAGLEDRFSLLTTGSRTAPPRHRTLRASIDWSYDLLSEPEQILLRRLSVFHGGWSLEAALAVCSDREMAPDTQTIQNAKSEIQNWPVLDLLGQLVEKSLVVREGRRGEARFRLLETINEYGRQKLQIAGELSRLRERHRDWFSTLVKEKSKRLWPTETEVWHGRIEREEENLRAALAWSLERGEAELTLWLGMGLVPFWARRGLFAEGREQMERLLSLSVGAEPTPARARLLKEAGQFARTLGRHVEARRRLEQSLELYRGLGDETAILAVLSDLAELALYREGNLAAGRTYLEEHLSRSRALGDPHAIAGALVRRCNLAHLEGDYRKVREFLEEIIRFRRSANRPEAVEKGLEELGYLAHDLGDHAAALALFKERVTVVRARAEAEGIEVPPRLSEPWTGERCPGRALRALSEEYLQFFPALGDRRRVAGALMSLGTLAFDQADYAAAQATWDESLRHIREGGDRGYTALALSNLADVARCRGQYDTARMQLKESLRVGQEIDQRRTIADATHHLGVLASDRGEWAAAETHLLESVALYQELGHQWPLMRTLCDQATLARRQGHPGRARELLEKALPRLREMGRQPLLAQALALLGCLTCDEGDPLRARAFLQESLAARRLRGDRLGIAVCFEALAGVDATTDQHEHAARRLGAAAALREATGAPLPPADRAEYDRHLATIRAALGEAAFAAAWAKGQVLSPDQTVE